MGKAGWVLFVMHLNSDSLFLLIDDTAGKYTASLFYFHLNTVTKYVLIGVVGGKATYIILNSLPRPLYWVVVVTYVSICS